LRAQTFYKKGKGRR